MTEVICHLENFPEAANKSVFDHYIVLIPSFAVVEVGRRGELKPKTAPNYWELIKNGENTPLLIGEVNGKCYFICYYMENNYELNNN